MIRERLKSWDWGVTIALVANLAFVASKFGALDEKVSGYQERFDRLEALEANHLPRAEAEVHFARLDRIAANLREHETSHP